MKLGLFGGTFDPVHSGHVVAAREARRRLGLDRLLFLPTADPPHKPPRVAPAWARYVMVELSVLGEEGLFVSPHELTPGRRAYTVETLEHFRRQQPGAELHFLLGSDALASLHTWRRWRDLVALARLVVLARPGWEVEEVRRSLPVEVAEVFAGGHLAGRDAPPPPAVVERSVDVSSSRIREHLSRGEELPDGWLPPLVLDYIHKYGLYR